MSNKRTTGVKRIVVADPTKYVIGLPLRDMSMDEWESQPDRLRAIGLAQGIYEIVDFSGEESPDGEESAVNQKEDDDE